MAGPMSLDALHHWQWPQPPGDATLIPRNAFMLTHEQVDYSTMLAARQQRIIRYIAVTSASISICAAFIASYWFLKMKKSFRHYLIMILIQCNMFRSVWFLIYPVLVITRGPVESTAQFCQVGGFFLALGTEAVDYANLMLAVHTSLHVFRPMRGPGEGGLYPYRRWMNGSWVVFALLMASLAFVNPQGGYVAAGTSCYLPVRPFWYRLALAWIPRYVIFTVIVALTIAIYTYVMLKFGSIRRDVGHSYDLGQSTAEEERKRRSSAIPLGMLALQERNQNAAVLPKLACHGLIPEESPTSPTFTNPFVIRPVHRNMSLDEIPFGASVTLDAARHDSLAREAEWESPEHSTSSSEASKSAMPSYCGSRIGILHALTDEQAPDGRPGVAVTKPPPAHARPEMTDTFTPIRLVDSSGQSPLDRQMQRTHARIRRELRMLFIYPASYLVSWTIPLVAHCFQYSDYYVRHPPFVLTCLTVMTLALQCTLDCLIFTIREKPWKHIPNSRRTILASFCFWAHSSTDTDTYPHHRLSLSGPLSNSRCKSDPSAPSDTQDDPAFTSRTDMTLALRHAYLRRDAELAIAAANRERARAGQERFWWEEEARRRKESSPFPSEAACDDDEDDDDDEWDEKMHDEESAGCAKDRTTDGRRQEMIERVRERKYSLMREDFNAVPLTMSPPRRSVESTRKGKGASAPPLPPPPPPASSRSTSG